MNVTMPLVACALAMCLPRLAAQTSLTFDLGASGETFHNEMVFANGGVTATATGWSVSRTSSTPVFEQSQLAQWSPGIGVRNSSEFITDTPYVPFYVDNQDHYDFVLFVFDEYVDVTSVRVSPSAGTFDLDVSYWMGSVDPSLDLTGYSFADLASAGFGSRINDDWYATNTPRTVGVTTPEGGVNALLFGSRVNGDSSFDRFKISTFGLTTIPNQPGGHGQIPEPGAAGLLAFGMALIVIRRRR